MPEEQLDQEFARIHDTIARTVDGTSGHLDFITAYGASFAGEKASAA